MFNRKKQKQDNHINDKDLPAKNAAKSGVVLPLSDDEPTEKFRIWWSENGKSIIAGVVLGVVAIIGYQYWQSSKITQAKEASEIFSNVLVAYQDNDNETLSAQTQQLVDGFGSTDYAAQSQILNGISLLKEGKVSEAIAQLDDAVDRAKNPVTQHLSRLNLAKSRIESGNFDEAIKTLEVTNVGGYASQFDELNADALALNGSKEDAAQLYQKVLDTLNESDSYVDVIQAKINNL